MHGPATEDLLLMSDGDEFVHLVLESSRMKLFPAQPNLETEKLEL